MDWHCSITDCPIHPEYDNVPIAVAVPETSNIFITSGNISLSNEFVFSIPSLDYPMPVQCLLCKHCEKFDMREKLIIYKAKKALED
jgi:hypothetical protein